MDNDNIKERLLKNIIFSRDLKSDENIVRDEILRLIWDETGDTNLTLPQHDDKILEITEMLSLDLVASAVDLMIEYKINYINHLIL